MKELLSRFENGLGFLRRASMLFGTILRFAKRFGYLKVETADKTK